VRIDSLAELEARLATHPRSLAGWHVRGVDLTGASSRLRDLPVAGASFLGCQLDDATTRALERGGALVYAALGPVPVDPARTSLYTPGELYDALAEGRGYAETLDARAYAWSRGPADRESTLTTALHDHAVDTALAAWVQDRRLVGVMGGHALPRGSSDYAAAARLGRALGTELTVATGGGPGAMEAANLGARTVEADPQVLESALARLAAVPSFRPDAAAWVRAAWELLASLGPGRDTLGIPTWHYGHEPPNPFATAIAKYFHNAQREAVLLQVCDAGIVFLPGAGGTVQEIFQDACENYYADESSVAPMVLVGHEYWTETLPAWPLLKALARGRAMEQHVHLVDSEAEAADVVTAGVTGA